MAKKDGYGAVRLKAETLGRLRELKESYELTYGKKMSYDEFMSRLMACVEDGDLAVWELYCLRQQQKDEALEKVKELSGNKQ